MASDTNQWTAPNRIRNQFPIKYCHMISICSIKHPIWEEFAQRPFPIDWNRAPPCLLSRTVICHFNPWICFRNLIEGKYYYFLLYYSHWSKYYRHILGLRRTTDMNYHFHRWWKIVVPIVVRPNKHSLHFSGNKKPSPLSLSPRQSTLSISSTACTTFQLQL